MTADLTPPQDRSVRLALNLARARLGRREELAKAWDEGYRNGYAVGFKDDPDARTCYENPYRGELDPVDAIVDAPAAVAAEPAVTP